MRKAAFLRPAMPVFCVLIFSGSALADGPAEGRYLSDPAYLPLTGEVDGLTSFSFGDGHAKTFDADGDLSSRSYEQSYRIGQTLQYGITDDLSANVGISYLPFDKHSRTLISGKENDHNDSGFTDPSFGLTWRAVDQGAMPVPVNLDLFGSYSPDWVGNESASAVTEGSEGRGGQEGRLGVAVSHVTPMFTIYGSAAADIVGSRNTFDPVTGDTAVRDSATHWNLDLATQTRVTDALSLDAGVGETLGRDSSRITSTSGIERLNDPGDTTSLRLAVNYAFVPQAVVGSLTYGHTFDGTSRTVFPTSPADDTTTRGRQQDIWGARVNYVLN